MGDADRSEPRTEEVGIPFAVSLECAFGCVEVVAVELCDEVLGAPDEVDYVAGDPLVDLGGGQAVAFDEAQEVVFEV